jgi:hypothetical protein
MVAMQNNLSAGGIFFGDTVNYLLLSEREYLINVEITIYIWSFQRIFSKKRIKHPSENK